VADKKRLSFQGVRDALRSVGRLNPWIRGQRRTLWIAAGVSVAGIAAEVARPWPVKVVIDQVILGQTWSTLPESLQGEGARWTVLFIACGSLLVLAGLSGFFNYTRTVLLAQAGQRVVASLRNDLHHHLMQQSLNYHGRQRTGDLLVRVSGDAAMMKPLLADGIFDLVQQLLLAFSVLFIMLLLDPLLALAAALTIPTIAFVTKLYSDRLRAAATKQRKKEGKMAIAVGELLRSIPVIQAYSLQKEAAKRFSRQNKKSLKAGVAASRLEGAMSRWTELALASGTAVILLLGTWRVLAGSLTPGELIVTVSYVRMLYKPLRRVVTRLARLVKGSACVDRILEVMEAPLDLVPASDPIVVERARGEIHFQNVGYEYERGRPVLADINLTIPAGRHVAIVGRNGSGKSTLTSLVPRLRDVSSGEVMIDGVDVRKWDLASLRRQIAFAFQEAVLFDGSILENIRLGRTDASEAEVYEAARLAGVTSFVEEQPDGFDTAVGESGLALSGGQRQRVSLARTLLRDAPIVILDEPAASLDTETEILVSGELMASLRGQTVLCITHKLELLEEVDEIVLLDAGKLVDHGALLKLGGGAALNRYLGGAFGKSSRATGGSPR